MDNAVVNKWELVECGVDWLTATYAGTSNMNKIGVLADKWQRARAQDGWELKPWNWNGYRGSTVDGCTWGVREDGAILRLSGSWSRQHFMAASLWATNVSRIDVQATVYNPAITSGLCSKMASRARRTKLVESGITQTQLIVNTPSGETLNIGSRASNRYYRLYDKAAESKGEYLPGTWRFEIEYKSDRALRVAQKLQSVLSIESLALELLGQAYLAYDIIVPIKSKPIGWHEQNIKRTTTDQRRLEWLKTSIRPCVSKMSEAYDADTLAEALGLYRLIDQTTGEIEPWSTLDVATEST